MLALALASQLCLAATGPPPDEFERYLFAARELFEKLEFERAYEQLQKAKGKTRGVADDVTVALYEGILKAELSGPDEASAAFRTALLLDPGAKLPVTVSPTVRELFDRAQADALKAHAKNTVAAPKKTEVVATAPDSPASPDRRPLALVPGIAALAFAGGSIALLFIAQGHAAELQRTMDPPVSLMRAAELRERGFVFEVLGLVGAGVAAAAAVTAVIVFIRGAPVQVAPAAAPGGGGLLLQGSIP